MTTAHRRSLLALLALFAVLAAEGVAIAVLLPLNVHRHVLWLEVVCTPISLAAAYLLTRMRMAPRGVAALIVGVGAVLQIIAVMTPPTSSDDDYRYVWDAKVQLAGIDPYRYAPVAPQLDDLRDGFLFPARASCSWPIPGGCSAINRPTVHTIYPPVAEGAFTAIRVTSFGGHGNHLPLQLAAALGAIAVAWLLCRQQLARDRPLWTVALWAWCPLTVIEFGNGAHIDWLAVLLAVLALQSAARQRAKLAGVLAGAAIATKIYPVLVVPSLLRRRPGAVLVAVLVAVAASYLPHVLAVGTKVLGYLPSYLHDEQYASGHRFLLLEPVLPRFATTAVALLVLAGAAGWAAQRTDPSRPEDTAVMTAGVALLVTTPDQGWYAALLLALVAMSGAIEWLPVALVAGIAYLVRGAFDASPEVSRAMYAAALLATLAAVSVRRAGLLAGMPSDRGDDFVRVQARLRGR